MHSYYSKCCRIDIEHTTRLIMNPFKHIIMKLFKLIMKHIVLIMTP